MRISFARRSLVVRAERIAGRRFANDAAIADDDGERAGRDLAANDDGRIVAGEERVLHDVRARFIDRQNEAVGRVVVELGQARKLAHVASNEARHTTISRNRQRGSHHEGGGV